MKIDSEKRQGVKQQVSQEEKKCPEEMSPIELLEIYSYYTKLPSRNIQDQNYIGELRIEILKRMGYKFEN